MATRHFENAMHQGFSSSSLPAAPWMGGNSAPLRLARVRTSDVDRLQAARQAAAVIDQGNMGRCLRWAFGLEGGMAMLIYAIWSLHHLWR